MVVMKNWLRKEQVSNAPRRPVRQEYLGSVAAIPLSQYDVFKAVGRATNVSLPALAIDKSPAPVWRSLKLQTRTSQSARSRYPQVPSSLLLVGELVAVDTLASRKNKLRSFSYAFS